MMPVSVQISALSPLETLDRVQRAASPGDAWSGFAAALAAAGYERMRCYFGVPRSRPFPMLEGESYTGGSDTSSLLEIFRAHPEYTQANPVTRHCRTGIGPLLRAGEHPSTPFSPLHRCMLADLREVLGDVDLNVFPLTPPGSETWGNFALYTDRTAAERRRVELESAALHLAALYFAAGMQARFPRSPIPDSLALTPREAECLTWAAHGLVSKEIADRLRLSQKTVDLHIAHAIRRLGARTRSHAVARAIALALIRP